MTFMKMTSPLGMFVNMSPATFSMPTTRNIIETFSDEFKINLLQKNLYLEYLMKC